MKNFLVTRQDGKEFEISTRKVNWDFFRQGEAYHLVVTDAESDIEQVVGVYYDEAMTRDAAESLELFGRVPYEKISAADYLDAEGKLESNEQEAELKNYHALQYINDELDEEPALLDDSDE